MAINFPSTPAVGQEFTSDGSTFIWNGSVWIMKGVAVIFASEAEALAGIATDLAMSPLTTKAVIDANGGAGGSPFDGSPDLLGTARVLGTVYQNPYDKTMAMTISGPINIQIQGGPTADALINLARRSRYDSALTGNGTIALIPPRWFYSVTSSTTTPTVSQWREFIQ